MNTNALNLIIDLLRTNGIVVEADTLEDLSSKYHSATTDQKKEIANKIKSMCHVKWLGDVYIKNFFLTIFIYKMV